MFETQPDSSPPEPISIDGADDGLAPADVFVQSGGMDDEADERLSIPDELPVLPLRDSVIFPGTVVPLKIIRQKVQRVLNAALSGDRLVATVAQRRAETDDPRLDDLYRVGTASKILKLIRLQDGGETIIVQGIVRVGIVEITHELPYLSAVVQTRYDDVQPSMELEALVHSVRESARRAIELSPSVPDDAIAIVNDIPSAAGLVDFLSANLSLPILQKQELLETFDVMERLRKVHAAVMRLIEMLEMSQKIQTQVRGQMDRSQREYFLREQLKAIQQELGLADARASEFDKFEERIAQAGMPTEVEEHAKKELERAEHIPQASPEYSNAIDYLDWLCQLPWSKATEDRLDIKRAQKILNEDHYGLEKIKKRILEFLAVRKLNPDGRGPILCFAGPPGVGKTSLGQSIARALDRKFVRVSLGGARDEADIRGHRRTYVGALPGRIIQELRKAGANNPVFMLDEVDKLGQDFRGDPASALLEVLDPAQNSTFTDHYLDVPFDLSHVLFIATANYMEAIPPPLRDRMEVIGLPGYTPREKLEIAKRYLVPRQLEENGLKKNQIQFDDEALRQIISSYTLEAGVRGLDRRIAAVCRARAAAIVGGSKRSSRVSARSLVKDLGPPIRESEVAAERAVPGVVTGLAFTPVGGEILFVEATMMPGNGGLLLTGQIGDVMRESAQAAFSLIRSKSQHWRIDPQVLAEHDFHIHVPAGAVPKDGPSAGVSMFTALASLLLNKTVEPTTAMTGEITLRGAVLPVGGIREKVLAAHRAGLKRVLLPHRNMRDLFEVHGEIRSQIEFVPVKTVDRVVQVALNGRAKTKRAKSTRKKSGKHSKSSADRASSRAASGVRRVSAGDRRGSARPVG